MHRKNKGGVELFGPKTPAYTGHLPITSATSLYDYEATRIHRLANEIDKTKAKLNKYYQKDSSKFNKWFNRLSEAEYQRTGVRNQFEYSVPTPPSSPPSSPRGIRRLRPLQSSYEVGGKYIVKQVEKKPVKKVQKKPVKANVNKRK